ncbi:MAG TPA: NAD-dependent epimerase/dehydratase family protein [Bacteroidota bacterium]|nr:NAD-dependent epimerase/dehydratase family protein [Bacteroidota bacterium]
MKINAIVFGATGMVGEGVLMEALKHEQVESMLVISRRSCKVSHPKLKEIIHHDFYNFSSLKDQLKGYNACFFCLGVSSVGMKEAEYTHITYDLTMHVAATLSKLNPDMTFCYVSGDGTDSTEHGRLMWARVKGKTENDLSNLPFKAIYLFRPGLMKPMKGQKNVKAIFKIVAWPYLLLKFLFPNRVCKLQEVGLAMIRVSLDGFPKRVLGNRDITSIAKMSN